MSQHDFNIANQSFPATRTDLNNALIALASNSSGDAEPATKYANQWWYETDTNTLKLRNEANDAWISIAVLDQSGNAVQSITTAGLTLGATAISATGTEINQLSAITRGSIIYGNASGATARLAAGGASTVLTSDGTDISWSAAGGGGGSIELISTTTISSNVTTVSITSGFNDSTYYAYEFRGSNFKIASGGASFPQMRLRVSNDGGSSYETDSTYYGYESASGVTGTTSKVTFPNATMDPGDDHLLNFHLIVIDPLDTGSYTMGKLMSVSTATSISSHPKMGTVHWHTRATETTNAFQFDVNGGQTLTGGSIALYGIKR